MGEAILLFKNKMEPHVGKNDDWQILCSTVEIEKSLNELKVQLSQSITENVEKPLSEFDRKDIQKAKEAKSKWSQARLAYDASVGRLENENKKGKSTKLKEMEAECNSLKATFTDVNRQTSKYLENEIQLADITVAKCAANYLSSLQQFFEKGNNLLSEIVPEILEMKKNYETRQDTLNETKASLEEILFSPNSKKKPKENRVDDKDVNDDDDENLNDDQLDDLLLLASDDDEEIPLDDNNNNNNVIPENPQLNTETKPNTTFSTTEPSSDQSNDSQDVGETLRKIMDQETKKMEEDWEAQQKAKDMLLKMETLQKQKIEQFDASTEFQYDSKFHKFLTKTMRVDVAKEISSRMRNLRIDELEETLDAGKLGEVTFGVQGLSISDVDVPNEGLTCTFDAEKGSVTVVWSNITASLRKFSWHYRKETFPKLKDNGNAEASISDTIVSITLQVDKTTQPTKLKVVSTATKIGSLDVKISGSAVSVIYNLVLGAFSNTMRSKLQDELVKGLDEFFQRRTANLIVEFVETN